MACPSCKKPALPRAENAAFPFCCDRCRLIDLGNWLSESYRIPTEEEPDGGVGGGGAGDADDDERSGRG